MSSAKKPEELGRREAHFCGEQDGPAERELKERLKRLPRFAAEVSEAYLARVTYPPSEEQHVALCLVGVEGREREIVEEIAAEFAMFKATEHLDIVFLSDERHNKIKAVAKPFFQKC